MVQFPNKKKTQAEIIADKFPAPAPAPQLIPPPISGPSVIRDETTGKLSGITVNDKSFLGLPAKDIKNIAAKKAAQAATPIGTTEATEVARQKKAIELGTQVGNVNVPTDIQKEAISYEQAIKSGLAGVIPGAAGGAAIGAAGGSVVPGVGTAIGAVALGAAGAVTGFLSGFRSNLKTQRSDIQKGDYNTLMKSETNLKQIVRQTNAGGDPYQMLEFFNDQMSLIDETHSRLKLETTDDLSKWLGVDGHQELSRYEDFNSPGGAREILTIRMQEALLNPDPNKALTDISDLETFE